VFGVEIDGIKIVCMKNASMETAGPAHRLTMPVPLLRPNNDNTSDGDNENTATVA